MKFPSYQLPWARFAGQLTGTGLPVNWRRVHRQRVWLCTVAASALVCSLAGAWMYVEQRRLTQALTEKQAVEAALAQAQAARAVELQAEPAPPRKDLAPLDAPALLGHLKHFSEDLGLGIPEVTFSEPSRVDAALMRVDIFVSVKGRYPPIKDLLRETLDRYPAIRLVSLEMAQAAPASVAEAKVQWAWFSAAPPPEVPHVAAQP